DWLLLMRRPASGRTRVTTDGQTVPATLLTDQNGTLLKGLAWTCAAVDDRTLAAALGDAAAGCLTKVAGSGPRCLKGGNGCIKALTAMQSMDAVAQLVRLQQRVAHRQSHQIIEGALQAAARRTGLTKDDLADMAAP